MSGRTRSLRGGIGDRHSPSRQPRGPSPPIRNQGIRRAAVVVSASRVMRGFAEQGLATSVAKRGTWPRIAPRGLQSVFTATRPDTGRPSVRNCEGQLRDPPLRHQSCRDSASEGRGAEGTRESLSVDRGGGPRSARCRGWYVFFHIFILMLRFCSYIM